MKKFAANVDPLELLREREAIYLLLPNITIEKNHAAYTIDPSTRYPASVLKGLVPRVDIASLYDKGISDPIQVVKKELDVLVKEPASTQVVSLAPSSQNSPSDDCKDCQLTKGCDHSSVFNHKVVSADDSSHYPQ